MYYNYDYERKVFKSCLNCGHRAVCGMYDVMFNATLKIDKYEELHLGYEGKLYETLALSCRQYEEY